MSADLKRIIMEIGFLYSRNGRLYISYTYRVEVTTYVVCSSRTKTVLSSLTQGINTYHVIPIRLKDWNADQLFSELFEKKEDGEILKKQELHLRCSRR